MGRLISLLNGDLMIRDPYTGSGRVIKPSRKYEVLMSPLDESYHIMNINKIIKLDTQTCLIRNLDNTSIEDQSGDIVILHPDDMAMLKGEYPFYIATPYRIGYSSIYCFYHCEKLNINMGHMSDHLKSISFDSDGIFKRDIFDNLNFDYTKGDEE